MSTSSLRLHYLPPSPFSKKAVYVAKYYGVSVELLQNNPFIPEQRAALRELSAMGKLPVLEARSETGGTRVVSESSMVVEELESLVGRNDFVPLDPALSRLVRHWDRVLDIYLIAPTLELMIDSFQGRDNSGDPRLPDKLYRMGNLYAQLEAQLKSVESSPDPDTGRPTLLGGKQTLADLTALSILPIAHHVKPFEDYKRLSAYVEAYGSDPIWMEINKESELYFPDFMSSIKRAAA